MTLKRAHFNHRGCNSYVKWIFAFDNVNLRDVPYLMVGPLEQYSFRWEQHYKKEISVNLITLDTKICYSK